MCLPQFQHIITQRLWFRLKKLWLINEFFLGQFYYLNIHTKESQWDRPIKAAEPQTGIGPEQVQCSHLLVKHENSRRPSSWREEKITRTKDEALELIKCTHPIIFFYKKSKIWICISFYELCCWWHISYEPIFCFSL